MIEIVLATANLHKIREFREMLKTVKGVDLISLSQFPDYELPEETGKTFEENAILKAEHASRALGRLVLADDSGLVVPAIGGAPGVYSKRYAGENATDADNRRLLLKSMAHLQEPDRGAYFECSLALSGPEGLRKCVSARCEGIILFEERGRNGFGYDSLFIKYDYDKSFAELDEATKNRISHRHKALQRLLPTLETLKP